VEECTGPTIDAGEYMRPKHRRPVARFLTLALSCAALAAPAGAVAAWEEVIGGPSPINSLASRSGADPVMASVGGVPYVAWTEAEGAIGQIWVARLNAAGTAWERVGDSSPLNTNDARDAGSPSIAEVGGAPWVTWREADGMNNEIRVARLGLDGTWQQVGTGASPVNVSDLADASTPSLASVAGVAHVAWSELDGAIGKVHVARLSATGSTWDDLGGALNLSLINAATQPSLVEFLGVPYVAWTESDTNDELRVARWSGAAWVQTEVGTSPINHDTLQSAQRPALAPVAGALHLAWVENAANGDQVHVSRLNAAGTDWAPVVGGDSPVNRSSARDAKKVWLTAIGSAPYVSWIENDGANDEVRVSRLGATGTSWEEIAPGPSPLNAAPDRNALQVHVATVGGIPWLTWSEENAGAVGQIRVARLEPEFGPAGAVATVNGTVGATLFGSVKAYGLPYQAGFTVTGPGGGDTGLAPTSGDLALLQRDVSGLTPVTAYTYRPFATAGVAFPRVLGPVGSLTTLAAKPPASAPPVTTGALVASWVDRSFKTRAGTRIRLRYVSTRAGRATLELRRGTRLVRRFRATPRAGLNAFTFLAPTAGSYRLILTVTTPDAKTAKATTRLFVRKR
jgi:hypothetical protein